NQRRFGISPFTGFAAEVRAEIFLPAHLARWAFQAGQITVGTERVEELALDRWRGAGGGKIGLLLRITDLAQAGLPDSFAVLDAERLDELVFQPVVAQQIQAVANHGGRRVTETHIRHLPL